MQDTTLSETEGMSVQFCVEIAAVTLSTDVTANIVFSNTQSGDSLETWFLTSFMAIVLSIHFVVYKVYGELLQHVETSVPTQL